MAEAYYVEIRGPGFVHIEDESGLPEDERDALDSALACALLGIKTHRARFVLLLAEIVETCNEIGGGMNMGPTAASFEPMTSVENAFIGAAYDVVRSWSDYDKQHNAGEATS